MEGPHAHKGVHVFAGYVAGGPAIRGGIEDRGPGARY
jgi:hypothetical protein